MIVLYEKLKQCHLVLGLVPPVDQSGMRLTTFCKNRSWSKMQGSWRMVSLAVMYTIYLCGIKGAICSNWPPVESIFQTNQGAAYHQGNHQL